MAMDLDTLCVNTLRTLAMDAVQKANSGHPGAPMGMAPAAYTLWTRIMNHYPENPQWPGRDRFVLSAGHASMLIYGLLYLTGYDLSLEDIKNFRQWGSKTPGHPEYGHTAGVETTTGPLGQGVANAVGFAMAERHLAARFNRPDCDMVDHFTYVMCGDGDLMEGVASEAASLAGHLGLGRLICLYDDNKISIEGSTDMAFSEDVGARFAAYGWQVLTVADGTDVDAIEAAVRHAKAETDRPTLIKVRTEIAFGSPNKQGKSSAHGAPLGADEIKLTKEALGWPADKDFYVPEEALAVFRKCVEKGRVAQAAWTDKWETYAKAHPELAAELDRVIARKLPENWDSALADVVAFADPLASRAASGKALNALATKVTDLFGGSADLAPSNKTLLDGETDFSKQNYAGRNIRFGVREHAMGAVLNGMALHGGVRPYGGTFLVFADYMRPAIRLAALMKLPVIYVFTHDSVAVGEDGPTHQPVEHLAALRCIPGLTVIRPATTAETAEAWRYAVGKADGPVALLFSRQKLAVIPESMRHADGVEKGGYVLSDADGKPDAILLASGAEVGATLEAQKLLKEKGVAARVVNMPSWDLFEKTEAAYKASVLPPEVTARVAVEAGHPMGWERYTGIGGAIIGISGFGTSAPGGEVLKRYGFTAENIAEKTLALLGK